MNIFEFKEEFFVIDSENLEQISSRLYGYTLLDGMLIEDELKLSSKKPDGDGAYVYVERLGDKILVTQDFIGSFGLYLYRNEDYFALSNSFLTLVDHVKKRYMISLNRDFADYMLAAELCSAAYSETMVREITLLDRCARIEIDVRTRALEIGYIDYEENTVELNSEEGMKILDSWFRKWTAFIENACRSESVIQFDLSGGFDSRLTINLLLGAGLDRSRVFINSMNDGLHTHTEDYEIASLIAKKYGFSLNDHSVFRSETENYTLDDAMNISFNLKLCFHKQMYMRLESRNTPIHYFGGSGGECIRSYWNISEDEYIQKAVKRCGSLPESVRERAKSSTQRVLKDSFEGIKKKYRSYGREIAPEDLALFLYRETRCRNHFGKDFMENYYGGAVKFAPLLDRELHRLKLSDHSCTDRNLLAAVMLDRKNPGLLDFRFDSGRAISEGTIEYARKINSIYPADMAVREQSGAVNDAAPRPRKLKKNSNPPISQNDIKSRIQSVFDSVAVKKLFTMVYPWEVYEHFRSDVRSREYQSLQGAYTVIGISRIVKDSIASESMKQTDAASSFRSNTIVQDNSDEEESLLKYEYLKNHITARIDIQTENSAGNSIELVSVSDKKAEITSPKWMSEKGGGYSVESGKGSLTLKLRCVGAGRILITLRGRNVCDENKKRIPFWIDYYRMEINKTVCFDNPSAVWHDKPRRIEYSAADGEIISLSVEWKPHNELICKTSEPYEKAAKNNRPAIIMRIASKAGKAAASVKKAAESLLKRK